MPFTIMNDPTAGLNPAPFSAAQARPDKVHFDILAAAFNGTQVVSGCVVSAQGSPNMTVQVSAGSVQVGFTTAQVSAVASLTVTAASANNRRDLIVVSNAGVVSIVTGSVIAAVPDLPNVPSNSVAIAVIDLSASTTSITSANITDLRVVEPVTQTQILGSLAVNTTVVHQGKPVLLLSGTFVAWAPTQMFRIDAAGQVYGGGYGGLGFLLGNNGGLATTPLYAPSVNYVSGNTRFAGTVNLSDAHNYTLLQGLQYEQQSAVSEPIRITGLTVGTTYTWQLIAGCSGGATASYLGRGPQLMAVSPDNKTVWTGNFNDGTVQPTTVGYRPGWLSLGTTTSVQQAGPPIATGTQPYGIVPTPDGKYVVTANLASQTVSVINAQTRRLVGNTSVFAGLPAYVTVTQDGTVAWVVDNTGKAFPVTLATQVVGSAIQVGLVGDTMGWPAMSADGKTLWITDITTKKVYPVTLTSNTTGTVGAAFTLANAPTPAACCTTAATIANATNIAAATIACTVIAGVNNFPTTGGTIRVPVTAGPPITYQTITYTSCATSGTTITFSGCTGGSGTSIAGNVVIDEGVWVGDAGSLLTQIRLAGVVQTSPALGIGSVNGVAVLADGQEVWAVGGGNKFAQIETNDAAINTPATSATGGRTFGQGIALTTDGYVFVNYTDGNVGLLLNFFAGQFSILPQSPSAAGQQFCTVSASVSV